MKPSVERRVNCERSPRACTELVVDVERVALDRGLLDKQELGDLKVRQSLAEQFEDLSLARSKSSRGLRFASTAWPTALATS